MCEEPKLRVQVFHGRRFKRRCEVCGRWAGSCGRGVCVAQPRVVGGRPARLVTLAEDGVSCELFVLRRASAGVHSEQVLAPPRGDDELRGRRSVLMVELLSRPEGATVREAEQDGVTNASACIGELRRRGAEIRATPDHAARRTYRGPVPYRYRLDGWR